MSIKMYIIMLKFSNFLSWFRNEFCVI